MASGQERPGAAYELGEQLAIVGRALHVGEVAPDFALETLDTASRTDATHILFCSAMVTQVQWGRDDSVDCNSVGSRSASGACRCERVGEQRSHDAEMRDDTQTPDEEPNRRAAVRADPARELAMAAWALECVEPRSSEDHQE